MISAPRIAPKTVPRPPIKLVPPITQAAIASSSSNCPGVGRSAADARGVNNRSHAGQRAHDAEDRENVLANVYSGKTRRIRVAADRVKVTTEGCVLSQERSGQRDGDQNDHR